MVQVQHLWTSIMYGLEILHQCGKSIKTKSQKVLEASFYVCKSSMKKKTGGRGATVAWKYRTMFWGKVMVIIQSQVKKIVNKLKVSWRKSMTKKFLPIKPCTAHRSTVRTGTITNYYKNYFTKMLQTFMFKLRLSCLKSLRSTYLVSYPHLRTTFPNHCLCLFE